MSKKFSINEFNASEVMDSLEQVAKKPSQKSVTLDKDSWILDTTSDLYKYEILDDSITEEDIANVIIDNESYDYSGIANILSLNDTENGKVILYAKNQPENDIDIYYYVLS